MLLKFPLLTAVAALVSAGIPHAKAANLWPNTFIESDSNSNGIPDFWNKGGSSTSIDLWTTETSTSPSHALKLADANSSGYGSWYSDRLGITGGTAYQLSYQLRYLTQGDMRVGVSFFNAVGSLITSQNYLFSGTQDFWSEKVQHFTAPDNATALSLEFTSGGSYSVTGTAWVDDIALTIDESLIPQIESFPKLPDPMVIRNWKQTAQDYHQLAFNASVSGQFLPILYQYTETKSTGYTGTAFGLPSYVGDAAGRGEALTVLGAVLGGTLTGFDMASLAGQDRVQQCEKYYSIVNGRGLVVNNVNSKGGTSAWYHLFPSALFFHIGSYYPDHASFQSKMRAVADSWNEAVPVLSNNWNHQGFSFTNMAPTDGLWVEPDMAIGIAWLEYMAYVRFNDEKYLVAADTCMTQMNNRATNPLYEILACYGPALSARMNAELGRSYSTKKYLNWIFSSDSAARPGWGCMNARWGGYDAYGLMGSTTDTSGYAFSMNTFTAAGLIAPLVRYEPQYARILGRWLLHVAANANLFYPDTLPSNMQANAAWAQQTGINSISYEGVRNLGTTTPYATGDRAAPVLELNPYGAWGCGWMAALFQTSNVSGILKIDCVATEAFPPETHPTFLYYNPHAAGKRIRLNAGSSPTHFYNALTGSFIETNAAGTVFLDMAPDSAAVVIELPAGESIGQLDRKILCGGAVIDYWNGNLDSDGDKLPDWWESFYFENTTNAKPETIAANGLSYLQNYHLGFSPRDPNAFFKIQIRKQPGGYPEINWPSIGGKAYAVKYTDRLTPATEFVQALTITETNVPAGATGIGGFTDSSTNGAARFYRVDLVIP